MIKFAIVLLILGASAATAQNVVGTTIVDGRRAQLLDDFTWRYMSEDAASSQCNSIDHEIEFCGKQSGWKSSSNKEPEIAASFFKSDREYLNFIVEQLGTDDGLTLDFMSKAVVENAANGIGVTAAEVPIYSESDRIFLGNPARTIVFQINVDGIDVIMINTHWIWQKSSGQILTYRITRDLSGADLELHEDALSATRRRKE